MSFLQVPGALISDTRHEISSRKKATMKFVFFNIVRSLSIFTLLLVLAATVLAMATNIKAVSNFELAGGFQHLDQLKCPYIDGSTVPNQAAGVFWSVLESLLIVFQTIVLILSEIGWPAEFFNTYFPVLGSDFGLGPLGIFEALIATQILSHHVDKFSLVSAFFLFSVGALNALLGIMRSQPAKELRSFSKFRARQKRGFGLKFDLSVPHPHEAGVGKTRGISAPVLVSVNQSPSAAAMRYVDLESGSRSGGNVSESDEKTGVVQAMPPAPVNDRGRVYDSEQKEGRGLGFGQQAEKKAGLRGFLIRKPLETLPRYASSSSPPSSTGLPASPASSLRRDRRQHQDQKPQREVSLQPLEREGSIMPGARFSVDSDLDVPERSTSSSEGDERGSAGSLGREESQSQRQRQSGSAQTVSSSRYTDEDDSASTPSGRGRERDSRDSGSGSTGRVSPSSLPRFRSSPVAI